MCFLRNRSSYSFETCNTVIGMPENLRVHFVWPSKYKGGSDVLAQNVFSQKWVIIQLWNLYHCNQHTWKLQGALSLALQMQRKVMFWPKMCFLRNGSTYSFETCTIAIDMPENLRVHLVWPSKYKRKWFLAQNVFSHKWIIIQLWNLYHCNWHAWKLQGALSLAL